MNADLASWAIQVAQTCILKHDMTSGLGGVYPSVGQNIFMGSNFTYTSVIQVLHPCAYVGTCWGGGGQDRALAHLWKFKIMEAPQG